MGHKSRIMKVHKRILMAVCALVFVVSCHVIDTTINDSTKICPVHNIQLRKELVNTQYGLPAPEIIQANDVKKDLFPYAKEPVLGGCIVREQQYYKIWVCHECTKARNAWLKETRRKLKEQSEVEESGEEEQEN